MLASIQRSAARTSGVWRMSSYMTTRFTSSYGFNNGMGDTMMGPPASEEPTYLNQFEHSDDPKKFTEKWSKYKEEAKSHPQAQDIGDLVEPLNHPHQYEGFWKSDSYAHYNLIYEPDFPRPAKEGELITAAQVTRSDCWVNPAEPAIVSVGKASPHNFRPVRHETMPLPDSVNLDGPELDFREHRLAPGHADRRPFIYLISAGVWMVGATFARTAMVKAVSTWWLAKDVVASGMVEVDLRPIEPGQNISVKYRGKPVFVRHRTPEQIAAAKKDDAIVVSLRDPQTDAERCPKPEWLVCIGVCTHLGCIPYPDAGDFHGYFCPCHGSHYDMSGRIRIGPAAANLVVPPYVFVDEHALRKYRGKSGLQRAKWWVTPTRSNPRD